MTIAKSAHRYTTIVPVRFARAVNGAPVLDAPDVDDRGFLFGAYSGLTQSTARGAMVGIAVGDTVRIRVLREDIDPGATLFITTSDNSVVSITNPAGGGQIPANGIVSIRGVQDVNGRPVKIEVRFGAIDGPIIGELEPHVFSIRNVNVLVHLVTIDGVATTQTAAGLVNPFQQVNAIWRPAGINFIYNVGNTVTETIVGNQYRRRDGTMRTLPGPLGPAGTYATAGTVTTNLAGGNFREFSTLLQIHPGANVVNIYWVHNATEFEGATFDNEVARPTGYGIVMTDPTPAWTASFAAVIAHELGHFLNLDNHADENASGTSTRTDDMWVYRRLMCGPWPPANPAWRHDTGYGGGVRGGQISLKNLTRDPNDNETIRSRRRARNPY